jgi:serine/threonine protein phosphatase PrpC
LVGVTHLPEVQYLDLSKLFDKLSREPMDDSSSAGQTSDDKYVSIMLASDGIWDNWLYEDVSKFLMDSSCINAVKESSDGCKKVAMSFMHRNAIYSKKNFGSQADNATCIVMYIKRKS